MNTKYICMAAIFAMFLAAANANAQTAPAGALSLSNLAVSPNPIVAGSTVHMAFQLYNSYTQPLQNVNLYMEGAYPLLNFSPASSYLISSIGQGIYGGINSYIFYNLTIPKDTPTGVYTIYLYATYQTLSTTQSGLSSYSQTITGESVIPITLHVNGIPNITESSAVTSPIQPGEAFTMSMNLQNTGYDTAKNITINVYPSSNGTLKPIGSSTYVLGALPEGGEASIPISVIASQGIANNSYYMPVSITYYSSTGREYSYNTNMQVLPEISNPSIAVSVASAMPPMLYSGYNQSLLLSIQNIGYGTARNISISIAQGNGVSLLGSVHKFFIGALPQGSSLTEEVYVAANFSNRTSGNIIANATYYSSNYASKFSNSYNISLSFAPSAQFQIINTSSSAVPGATDIPITYTIKNVGNEVAKQVQVSFQSIYPITPINGNAYIASIGPGEEVNVTFLVNIDTSGLPGSYPVTLFETWKQPNGTPNEEYSASNNYFATVSSGSSGNSSLIWNIAIIVVVVAVATAFAAKRRKRSKK
ncbi:MAG: COG1361 S-layer family protein [Candidatus Micrarchaeia archaeon]